MHSCFVVELQSTLLPDAALRPEGAESPHQLPSSPEEGLLTREPKPGSISYPTCSNRFGNLSRPIVIDPGKLMFKPSSPPRSAPVDQAILCRGCGYDLRAHETGNRCPECGRSTYDARINATPVRMSIESDSGMGLLQLSFLFALIPLSGILNLSMVGGVMAVLAIFGPLFHITGQWRFNRSPLQACEESRAIGPVPLTAILELTVANVMVKGTLVDTTL